MERRAQDQLIATTERDIDQLFMPMRTAVGKVCRSLGDQPITPLHRAVILRVVDRELAKIYGTIKGDPRAPLTTVLTQRTDEAWRTTWDQAADVHRRILKRPAPETLRVLEGKVNYGDNVG